MLLLETRNYMLEYVKSVDADNIGYNGFSCAGEVDEFYKDKSTSEIRDIYIQYGGIDDSNGIGVLRWKG